ncbi:MAG TPA: cytochrome c biogenesis protein ResB [Actinomycetota bacterium]|jgi:cytochrome c biogenesis protein|nr:cytochrome c biogenesis protein ResB [Actinomycetota bacterium]
MSPPAPPRVTIRQSFALVWRTLRSMRTALVLLFLLAAAAAVGSLLPQIPNSPERVASYRLAHPFFGTLFLRAGFFDVYGSWWFALILTLLFVSLIACLLPRSRAMIRTIRQRPIQAREIDAFPQYRELRVAAEPGAAATTARTVLRHHGYRVALAEDGRAVAAEKGALREIGSLVFHWAFLVLLVAVIVGKGTGYVGHATIVEGQTWTDAAFNYDGDLRTGRFSSGAHTGIGIKLLDYSDAFRQSGVPMDFTSKVDLLNPDGTLARADTVTINHPVSFDGVRIFQFGFGWAPAVTITERGATIYHGPVVMGQDAQPGDNPLTVPWVGFVKLPTLRPQVAIKLELYPDSVAYFAGLIAGVPQPMTQANDPFMRYSVWKGKLLDPSLSGLDTRLMHQVATGGIGRGWTVDLARGCVTSGASSSSLPRQLAGTVCPAGAASGITMSFPELRQYSRLQISRDTTVPWVLGAAILILAGLVAAMYSSRRKLWVRAEPKDAGSVVRIGGFALQRKDRFEEAFPKIVEDLDAAIAKIPAERREEVGAR